MSRAPSTFRQSDVTRAVRAVAAAGIGARIEIERTGKIVIITEPSANFPKVDATGAIGNDFGEVGK